MILLIATNKERLHDLEFVKPIEELLRENNIRFFTKNYKAVFSSDLKRADKIIICGTSLRDNEFLENIDCFDWLLNFDKPVLGICAGMQIIGSVFDKKTKIRKHQEIGFYYENFKGEFLGLKGKQEVYHLHNHYVNFNSKYFKIYSGGSCSQAIKHKAKEIYGVLFHPEVRQKELIINFAIKI